ncbi:MAG TPA: hypothetical protein VEY71_02645 [Chitinophagales bacterium]|nr:hypothetical protein [Chitinophagales bacterium]
MTERNAPGYALGGILTGCIGRIGPMARTDVTSRTLSRANDSNNDLAFRACSAVSNRCATASWSSTRRLE